MIKAWTEAELAALPVHQGFRLRGLPMTRLEVFTDAAFAFALTTLIVSSTGVPRNMPALLAALKDVPAFLAGFVSISSFWLSHRQWSRRFGIEDGWSTLLSLSLIFVMLVFVYPLKMVFSAFFSFITRGALPTNFALNRPDELSQLFVTYGLGFAALTGLMALLHGRAMAAADALVLSPLERNLTRDTALAFLVMAGTGLASAAWAGLLPTSMAVWAGFWYLALPVAMPLLAIRRANRIARVV